MIIAIVIGVSCLFWIIAAILFVCAKGVDRRISESKKDCVEKTTATGVDVEEVYKRNVDTYNYAWYPAYEFYVNGERVVQKSVIGTGKNSVQTYCISNKNKPPAMQVCPQIASASSKKPPML